MSLPRPYDFAVLTNDLFAPKAAISAKVGFGALDDPVTPIAEAMLSSLIAATTKQALATRIVVDILAESPDRYAAAVCIAIRSDCYADILKAEAATCPRCEGAAGLLQTLSGCHDVFVERLLLFLLGCFLCLLRLLRFLGHVALRDPKVGLMQVISTCMHSKYTTIEKLILNASKKVNDHRAVATTTKSLGLAV